MTNPTRTRMSPARTAVFARIESEHVVPFDSLTDREKRAARWLYENRFIGRDTRSDAYQRLRLDCRFRLTFVSDGWHVQRTGSGQLVRCANLEHAQDILTELLSDSDSKAEWTFNGYLVAMAPVAE